MRAPLKVAVLVSGGGTNLQALIDAEADGKIRSGKLSLVISNKEGAFALERAKKAGIPFVPKDPGKPKTLADLEGMAPDVIAFSDDGRGVQNEDMMRKAMLQAKQLKNYSRR